MIGSAINQLQPTRLASLVYWPTEDNKGGVSEVIGLAWLPYQKGQSWYYCLAPEGETTGMWTAEAEVEENWVKQRDV